MDKKSKSSKKVKLILVRHGETLENQKNLAQGRLPGTLSENGKNQAHEIGKKLSKEKIDLIYSSQLKRAKDTAKIMSEYFPQTKIKFSKKIIERGFGRFEGQPYLPKWNRLVWVKDFVKKNDGESNEKLFSRVQKFLDKVKKKHSGKTIIVVTHKRVIQTIIALTKKIQLEEIHKIPIPENGKAIRINL